MKKKKSASKKRPSVMASVEAGDVEAVRAAIAAGAGLLDEMEDTSPLAVAVENNDAKMVETLLQLGHKPDLGGIVVPLALAARNGNNRIVELLLERGAKVNESGEEGETATMWAAGAGKLDILKRLIDAGADLRQKDRDGEDALNYAVSGRQAATIKLLLPRFPKARQEKLQRQSHLWKGEDKKASQVAARLQAAMQRPASKARDREAESLIRAFQSWNNEGFLQLVAAGADPNEVNNEGTTILTMAARDPELVKPLLDAGADPNRGELFRPLAMADSRGVAESVRLLFAAGADVNWADPDGGTALMSAAASGNEETVCLLLEAGANSKR